MKAILITLMIAMTGLFTGMFIQAIVTPAKAATVFDHSNCQYPARLSNPVDGCDNSDPARPECMKGGVEDCDLPTPDMTPWIPEIEPEITYCK